MNVELTSSAKLPKRRKARPECPPNIAAAMKEYARLYQRVYKQTPAMQYDRAYGFIRVNGGNGVGFKRLKELTKQLRERAGEQL